MDFDPLEEDIFIGENAAMSAPVQLFHCDATALLRSLCDPKPSLIEAACARCADMLGTTQQLALLPATLQAQIVSRLSFNLQCSDERIAGATAGALRPIIATSSVPCWFSFLCSPQTIPTTVDETLCSLLVTMSSHHEKFLPRSHMHMISFSKQLEMKPCCEFIIS